MLHHHALIDTCVWLNLVVDLDAEEIVNQLERLVNEKCFTLVVPTIIEEEFDRNKPDFAKKLAKRLSNQLKETLNCVKEYGEPAEKAALLPALRAFLARIAKLPITAEKMFERIERILRHHENKRIPPTSEQLEKAARRGCEKKAPFIFNKNSVADAVIVESFLEFVSKHGGGHDGTFSFVTVNKSDFCDLTDKRIPHPELGEPFSSGKVRFSINIADEINALVNTLLPAERRSELLIPNAIVQHVDSWRRAKKRRKKKGQGIELTCPHCRQRGWNTSADTPRYTAAGLFGKFVRNVDSNGTRVTSSIESRFSRE